MNATMIKGERSKLLAVAVVIAMVACALVAFMPSVDAEDGPLEAADKYTYDGFQYTGERTIVGDEVLMTYPMAYDVQMLEGMNDDFPRFVGALYRADSGATVKSITYNGVEYIWDAKGTLLGSNWVDADGKTLVKAVDDALVDVTTLITTGGSVELTLGLIDGTTLDMTYTIAAPVASIGTTYYGTLQAAVDAAVDKDTIVLNKGAAVENNTIQGDGVVFATKNYTITLDFNGVIYDISGTTVGSSGTETNGFQLLKDNSVTLKNGTVMSTSPTAGILLQNYCNLTLDGVVLDGRNLQGNAYVLSNNCGDTVITGATKIIASKGDVAFDVFGGFQNYPSVSVTIDENFTGEITGPIEIDEQKTGYSHTLSIEAQDVKLDSIALKNGSIELNGGSIKNATIDITGTGKLVANNGSIIDSTINLPAYAAVVTEQNLNGTVTFDGCKFNAAEGGSVAGVYIGMFSGMDADVNITDCEFVGTFTEGAVDFNAQAGSDVKVTVSGEKPVSVHAWAANGDADVEVGKNLDLRSATNVTELKMSGSSGNQPTIVVPEGQTLEVDRITGTGFVEVDENGTIDCPTIDVPIVDGTTGTVRTADALISALSNETVEKIVLYNDITIDRESRLEVTKSIDLGGFTLHLDCGEWRNGNLAIMASETQITIENGTIDAPDAIRAYQADITFEKVTFLYGNVLTGYSTSMAFNGCTFGTADGNTDFGVYYSSGNSCALTVNADCVFYGTYDQGAVALEGSAPTVDIDAYVPTLNIWISADEDTSEIDISGGIGETWVSGISSSTELTTKISIPGERVMLYDCRGNGGLTVGTGAELLTPEAKRVVRSEGFNFGNNGSLSEGVVVEDGDFVEPTVEIEGLPEIFQTYEEVVFSVTTTAGDYAGTMVAGIISGGSDAYTLYYLDNNEWEVMDTWFGPQTGFPLIDGTSYFKVVFDEPDQLDITIDIMMVDKPGEVIEGQALCSDTQKLLVQQNPDYKEPRQKDDYLTGFSIDGSTINAYILASEETSDYLSYYNPYGEVYFVINMYYADDTYEQVKVDSTRVRMTTSDVYGMLGDSLILAEYPFKIPDGFVSVQIIGWFNWDAITYLPTSNTVYVDLPEEVTIVDTDGNKFESGTIYTDKTLDLNALITPEDCDSTDVTWTSGDESIATVDENGVVHPVSAGTVTITVTTVNGITDDCEITVRDPLAVTGITVNGNVSGYYGYAIDEKKFESITITVTYNDESVETVPLTSDMVSGDIFNEGRLCAEGDVTADVTYQGFIAEDALNVTVGKLQSVNATTPTTIAYQVGETVTAKNLKEKGVSIEGTYSYGLQVRDILDLNPTFDPLTIPGGSETLVLEISYTEPVSDVVFTVSVTITVVDSTEEPIEP